MGSDPQRFVFDMETWLIAEGRLAPRVVCCSYQFDGGDVTIRHRTDDWVEDFRRGLQAQQIVGHNIPFDFAVAINAEPSLEPLVWKAYEEGRVFDTLIRAQLIAIALGRFKFDATIGDKGGRPRWSLDALVERFLGEKVTGKHGADIWRLRYHELDEVYPISRWPPAAIAYAKGDVDYTSRLWTALGRYAHQAGMESLPDEANQNRAAWALHLASCWGIRTDGEAVDALEARLRASVDAVRKDAEAAGLIRKNGTKDMGAIRHKVQQAYGRDTPKTAKGATRTDTTTLLGSGDPILVSLGEVSGDEKELSSFIPTLRAGVDKPINPRWNTLVESGRVSCSRPNLTQQPRRSGVRECYVPREGFFYATADFSFAELCTLGQVCVDWFGESRLADVINEGKDPHKATGATILGISYFAFDARHKGGAPATKNARQLAKAANFGYPAGLGAQAFVDYASSTYGLDIDEEGARGLKKTFLETYPEMQSYWRRITKELERGGGTFTGTLVRSGRARGGLGFTNGCNYYFQGPVADGAKRAFYLVTQESRMDMDSPLFGSHPLILMHDEIIAEVPIEQAAEAAQRIADIMVEALSEVCPDVKISAEPALMRRWQKGASPTYVDGRLVPWEEGRPGELTSDGVLRLCSVCGKVPVAKKHEETRCFACTKKAEDGP